MKAFLLFLFALFAVLNAAPGRDYSKSKWSGLAQTNVSHQIGFVESYGRICPNQQSECQAGYFCVENVLCLKGTPSQYSPLGLITAGAIAQLINDEINVACITDIRDTIVDLVDAFESYERSDFAATKSDLFSGIKDIYQALQVCQNKPTSWLGEVKKIVLGAIKTYAPEVYAGYIVLKDGVNVFEDFEGMMEHCSDSERDYIACGENFGNLIFKVYKAF